MRRYHQNGSLADQRIEPRSRFGAELCVADAKPFIHDQDVCFDTGRYGKRQAQHHATGIGSHGQVQVIPQPGEICYLVRFTSDVRGLQSIQNAAQIDIFEPRRIRVQSHRNIEQ